MVIHELRWFVAQAIGDDELARFGSGVITRRRDDYLLGTGDARGLKRRGGTLLEDKRRGAELELELELDGHLVRGSIERWTKHVPSRPATDGAWIGVDKRRVLGRYGACRAELTGLTLTHPAGEHQTLALELRADLASRSTSLRSLFVDGLRALGRAHPELLARYAGAPSIGYPAWLGQLQA